MAASKGLAAIFEAALSIADQFTDRLGIDVAIAILAREAKRSLAGLFVQSLELLKSKGGKKDVVILSLAFVALGRFGRDEPSAFFQIHVAPLGFEQFADAAEGAQADPYGALHARINWTHAGVFLASGQSLVVTLEALEDIAQFTNLIWRKQPVALLFVVMVEQLVDVDQVGRIAIRHQGAPRLTFFSPAQHLADVLAADHDGTVQAACFD